MKKLLIFITIFFSAQTFANHAHYAEKIADIIEYGDYFNGRWQDSWGQVVTVKNAVYFPGHCEMMFVGSKKGPLHEYTIQTRIDFAHDPIVSFERSNLSSSVKIIFAKAIVNSTSVNRRTGESRKNKEKVASFFFRPSDGRDFYQSLIDVLISYREFCTR